MATYLYTPQPQKFLSDAGTMIKQAPFLELPGRIDANTSYYPAPLSEGRSDFYITKTTLMSAALNTNIPIFTLKSGWTYTLYVASNSDERNVGYSVRFVKGGVVRDLTTVHYIDARYLNGFDLFFMYDPNFNYSWAYAEWRNNGSSYVSCHTDAQALLAEILFNSSVPDDPYGLIPQDERPGGYGPGDYSSEQELPPNAPIISAADVGFISLWNPTAAELKALANWLWTGNFAINTWRAITADPMDCILSVGIIPITPTRYQESGVDTKKEIEFAGSGSSVNSYRITDQYYVVDMGSLHIGGMSNSNMDYAPYAKASIFLPYCGTYALDVDEIMDADIALEYHIDIYTGACVAYLTISGKVNSDDNEVEAVMYQFTGNCLATIPVTSVDHSQFIQSLLFMGASVAATVATAGGGAGAAAAGADLGAEAGMSAGAIAATAGSAINTVMSMKPNVLHSGNLSSTAGFLGGQRPYITMTWSNLCRAEDEYKVVGMPLNKSGKLTDFEGLTVVSGVHLENIKCTDTERTMIEQALYKGVIV